MGSETRRGLILCLPLLAGIVAAVALGDLWPSDPAPTPPGLIRHTIDRGGTVRWNNGKADVQMAYRFALEQGANQLPYTVGQWRGQDFGGTNVALLTTDIANSILPEVIVNRLYRSADGSEVAFALVGSNTTRKLHRPEICYVAANWAVSKLPHRTIQLANGEITIDQFATRAPSGEDRIVAYAFVWGDSRRRIEDGAFIMQIGAPIRPGETAEAAGARLDTFVRQIVLRADPPPPLLALGGRS